MRILFITTPNEDYLADSLLLGFRKLFGSDCVDYPKAEILYDNCPKLTLDQVRGNGFTLYSGLLTDIQVDRYGIEEKIKSGFFQLIIFSDIQRQFGLFVQYRPWLTMNNTLIFDGSDTVQPYPARGYWWRRSYYWLLPKAHKQFLYFKREFVPETHFSLLTRILPAFVKKLIPHPRNLRRIAFAFPDDKIVSHLPNKTKDFPRHIVDSEVAENIAGSSTSYAFTSELEYYSDLQKSRFGITTKRAGWDCLRHYEIAANGAVMCFRNLNEKPLTCAPHGLIPMVNCLSYKNYNDLMTQIKGLTDDQYKNLQQKSIDWAKENSCQNRAQQILNIPRI